MQDPATRPAAPAAEERRHKRGALTLFLLDAALFVLLCLGAYPGRIAATRGDLWLDEADYCHAAVRGFDTNRHDLADSPENPPRIIRYRHYHPPMVAYAVMAGLTGGTTERPIRLPFVLAGCLTVGITYLCGLRILRDLAPAADRWFHPARLASLACAIVLLFAPPHIRSSSHALPWAFITLWLVCLTWFLAGYGSTGKAWWLWASGAALGLLFATSEVSFVAMLAIALAAPILLFGRRSEPYAVRDAISGTAGGIALFLGAALWLWPAGLRGGALTMLMHYVHMAGDTWPVMIRGHLYDRAPRWAYLYWYARYYTPFFLCYAAGAVTVAVLAIRRKLPRSGWALVVVTACLLASAHKAHIIGPEYLSHVLPFLSMLSGAFFVSVYDSSAVGGIVVALASCVATGAFVPPRALSGMDPASMVPRWPNAAAAVASRWKGTETMLCGQYGCVGRWYLLHVAGARGRDWQVQALPGKHDRVSARLRAAFQRGEIRYVAIGSSVVPTPDVSSDIRLLIRDWRPIWKSPEPDDAPSRIEVYARPTPRAAKPRKH